MSKLSELYDRDFLLWTEDQAKALRQSKGTNLPLDWDNLAEEIEDLGKAERKQVRSQIRRILHHFLKLEASAASDPRNGWRQTIRNARMEIEDAFEDSPSLRREVPRLVAQQIRPAAKLAASDLTEHDEPADAVWARLDQGGYTQEQVLGDWFPDVPA
jgi:hypothetical protein